jgi:murein DD-endopeptidase MepM/ murein hydrolase activator NlpD
VIGTSSRDESTDGDKFDDGQEFFGITYCPGGSNFCDYGQYPRAIDSSFISERLPTWIRPPGDSPFVAAYPVIEFNVAPDTIRVVTKEIKTFEKTITQGEEISTGFAETKGNSTTVGTIDTNTRSGWQEHSSSVGGIEPASSASIVQTAFWDSVFVEPDSSSVRDASGTSIEYICVVDSEAKFTEAVSDEQRDICASLTSVTLTGTSEQASNAINLYDQFAVAVLNIEVTPETANYQSAVVRWMPIWRQSLQPTGSPAYPILGSLVDGQWQWSLAGTPGYAEIYEKLPLDSRESELSAGLSSKSQDYMRAALSRLGGFYLPYPPSAGSISVTQGENGSISHGGTYAYDFGIGSTIIAIQDGEVIAVRRDSNVSCYNKTCVYANNPTQQIVPAPKCADDNCQNEMNYVTVKHKDGTTAHYWHFQPNSVSVNKGDEIKRGEPIGKAGRTGWSSNNHLHLEVRRNGATIPIGFVEISANDGVAQGGQSYSSRNRGQELLVCPREPICKNPDPATLQCVAQPTTNLLTQPRKSTKFGESIGRSESSWWGRFVDWLTPGSVRLADDTSQTTTCGVNMSCSTQVGGRSNASVDQSSRVSAGACASPPQTDGGSLGVGGGGSGLAFNDNGGGNFTALRTWSETTTTGEGWSTSHADLRTETEYAEITRSTVNTLVSSEAWSTATTADPTDAARMTFNYTLANTGSDLAVQVTGLRANLLIGDLPAITVNLPDRTNIEPDKAKGPFESGSIPLTLEQLAAIDNGAPIRVVLADYGYNDSLYDTNAWGRSVLFQIDDGIADGDESFDTYLIVTNLVAGETYQETLARYFPTTVFEGGPSDPRTGTLTSITTPEYDVNGEITAWIQRPVNERAWWELALSTGGETAGVKNFKDMPAKAKSYVYLRYMVDTDGDGYTDRTERDANTDSNDPESHPRPLLVAAKHTNVTDSTATVQLALQNLGDFDASSVEIWAIASDDSITIEDNLVGGGGRVRAGRRVVLGSRISTPDLAAWSNSTAKPAPSGQFDGAAQATFRFRADTAGTVGSSAGLQVSWSIDGATWTPLNVGSGYTPWAPLALRDGLSIAFSQGEIVAGESFQFETALPIDTFRYTINRTPHTPPLLVVSYNDAQGNHKFVADVEVTQIQEDLTRYYAEMQRGLQLDVRQANPFQPGGNRAWLTLHNPTDRAISGGKLVVEVVTPEGALAKEYVLADQTFQPGPNVITLDWNTTDFSPAFNANTDYHLLVYATDRQGTLIEHTLRDLDTLAKDALPTAIFQDTTWAFGTVTQGEILERTFALANVGYADLHSRLLLPDGLSIVNTTSRRSLPGEIADFALSLDTRALPTGPYNGTVTLRTSDPTHPTFTVQVSGTIDPITGDAYSRKIVEDRPLDVEVWVSGDHSQGAWISLDHPLGPQPENLHPVKVYSQDYGTLHGVGKYATDSGAGEASAEMFGTGRDGVLNVTANPTIVNFYAPLYENVSAGATSLGVGWNPGFQQGDEILIHQTQGTGAGAWEVNTITNHRCQLKHKR